MEVIGFLGLKKLFGIHPSVGAALSQARKRRQKLAGRQLRVHRSLRQRTALITRFRRACPGSERTSDGYIERPIISPFSPKAKTAKTGTSGQRQFGSCQLYPRPRQARRKILLSNRGVYRLISNGALARFLQRLKSSGSGYLSSGLEQPCDSGFH